MTNHLPCPYDDRRESALLDFLYGEMDPGERAQFELHLVACAPCRTDVHALRGVRQALSGWAPPEPMPALAHATPPALRLTGADDAGVSARRTRSAVPVWAKVAAAVLCVGVGAGAANLRISYAPDGLTVTTGWWPAAAAAPAAATVTAPAAWHAELAAIEQRLRDEMRAEVVQLERSAATAVAASARTDDDVLLRQVKALIARSEQRQQSELALRLGNVLAEVQTQRRADLARIDRTIGVVQNNTGMEVLRQREMLNSLAVRVSTQR